MRNGFSFNSAGSIGGDYYDYISLDESRTGVFIADVGCLHTQVAFDSSTNGIMQAMNRIVEKSVTDTNTHDFQLLNMYMSCCYIIIDTENGKFEFVNA